MACARRVVWRVVAAATLATGLSTVPNGALAGPIPPAGAALDPAPDAAFETDRTEMPIDATRPLRAIPVRVNASRESDRLAQATSDDPSILAIERGGRILPGQSRGYVLVRPIAPGETTLHVGESAIKVRVIASDASSTGAFGYKPELLTPSAGAGVWGPMHIGAAYWRIPGESDDSAATIKLRIGEGAGAQTIEPTWTTRPDDGPFVLCSFPVDFTQREPGPCSLRVIRTDAAGREHLGTPAVVQVVRPPESSLVQGECEADYGLMPLRVMGPPKPPASSQDKNASGGRFFNNAGADPKFRFPLNVTEEQGAGWYQVVLTAAGDAAAGALPSIAITIDEAQRPITASAIASPTWHRIPIGTPIRLEPGFHAIRCDYVNDFGARGLDRNLRLDKVEIARVADAESSNTNRRPGSADAMAAMTPAGGDAMMSMNAMAGPGGSSSGAWPASARAGTRPPVRIAFERPLEGQPIAGEVEIRGTLWTEDQKNAPPPQVALIINGREVQRQRSDAPRFVVPPETFRAGDNLVQLRAITDGGQIAATTPQRVVLPAELALSANADHARISRRFTIYEDIWTPSVAKSLRENQGGDQRKSAAIAMSSQLALQLPDDLAGEFDIWIESRCNNRNDRRVELQLLAGAADAEQGPPRPVAAYNIPSWFDAHRVTPDNASPLALVEGPKRLLISLPTPEGTWVPGKGEKNTLWIQGVRLVERTPLTAAASPSVALDYPRDHQAVRGVDALVASVMDANSLDWAEPLIDGKPIGPGLRFDIKRTLGGVGRVIVPLPLRGVSSGPHQVSLRIADLRGKITTSSPRTVDVQTDGSGADAAQATTYDRALMLLDRFAYGPDSRELADALVLGPDRYLESRLNTAEKTDRSDAAAQDLAAVRLTNPRSSYDVPRRAIQESIATGNPVRNRFTLWAENHFSTWVRKTDAWRKWDEHERFTDLGVARFYDLLFASATSPAMLRYLDQERSYGGRLNENYAREIMELHTLGVHGGYSQQDVTNLAHVFTGWTTARTALAAAPDATPDEDGLAEDFRYEPMLGSELKETRDVVGYRFAPGPKADRHQRVLLALEVLAAHPATAQFVCTKLANHYVGVPQTASDLRLVDDLASVFTRTGGDMKQVLLALSRHPAFWSAASAKRLSHPTDYAFRLARTSGWMNPQEIGGFLDSSGHGLFDRPTPDGYSELDGEAMDSNAILQRWKLASKADYAIADGIPGSIRWSAEPITPELRQIIVDIIAIRLTGRTLGEASNIQALAMLAECQPVLPARPDDYQRDNQIKTVATFIAQLPESNVR